MKLHVLGSSSSGNCYLFQSEKTGEVLAVEAGVKFNKVKKVLDFNLNSIVGCIVSHEHGDHAKCVGDFINACIPCYMSQGTKHALGFSSSYWAKGLLPFEQVVINGFRVIPFPVQHDAAEPYGYLIRHEECGTVLFATDTYFLKYKFPGLNNVMLECNYSKEILDANFTAGRIDKKRYERTIKSHMSYDNCLLTLQANDLSQVCNILLLHLSDNNSNATEFIHGIERLYPEIEITAATNGLSLTLPLCFTACQTDEIPVPPEGNGNTEQTPEEPGESEDDSDKPINEELLLGLDATLKNLVESRSGVINAWQTGNEIGLYTEDKNLKYTYNGSKWIAAEPYEVQKEQTVYAYHPYSENIRDMYLDIDVTKQEDVMYGQCVVTSDFPTAKPEMNHALSLVRVKILRDEYLGEGKVTDVTIRNVTSYLRMNIQDGAVWKQDKKSDIPIGGGYMLNDANPTVPEAILPPLYHPQDVSVSFKLDGKDMSYTFPSYHEWEAGKIYTYSIKIKGAYNGEVNKEDVPIDVEYWSQFGKTDDIVIREVDFSDFENQFSISTNHTQFGYDCYQNEGKPFGLFYTHWGSELFEGKVRFVFMQGSQIVEKFQPIDIKVQGNWDGKKIQCYVTAAPGTYQLVPLFQRKGEST